MLRLTQLQRRRRPQPESAQRLLLSLSRFLLTGVRHFSVSDLSGKEPRPGAAATIEPAHFMVDYLVSSCGLSRAEAAKASKYLAHLKSPEKPGAVLHLLRTEGLSDAHIRRLVRSHPRLLVADAETTLEPKIRALQQAGFSKPELAQLISANPTVLSLRDAIKKIEFWRKMFGGNEQLLKVAKTNNLLSCKVDGEVGNPNLYFLRSLGVSDLNIVKIITRRPRIVSFKLSKIVSIVEQVKRLGIAPGSGMFLEALSTVSNLSQTTLEAKCELLRGFGWSDDELVSAFQRFPVIFRLSENRISRAMEFLLKEAGFESSYVAQRPTLLGYSIDRRLVPRYFVVKFLKKKGLPGGDANLFSISMLTEQRFMEKYISPIKEIVGELLQTYPEARAVMSIVKHSDGTRNLLKF